MLLMNYGNICIVLLLACRLPRFVAAVPLMRRLVMGRTGLMDVRSEGQMFVRTNQSHVDPHQVGCQDAADCVSHLCDTDGNYGCKGHCVSVPDGDGQRYCSTRQHGQPCSRDGECLSGMCDQAGEYGCKDLCLSEVEDDTRHCRTGHMGDRCTHNNQCLSGVCDTKEEYNCKDLCVSDVLPSGHGNRYCLPKKVGETCNHNENCETGICDTGYLDRGLCANRCATQSSPSCPRQQCMPNCDVCLGDLLSLPSGHGMSRWTGYPEHLWDHQGVAGLHLKSAGHQKSMIYMRIPASCVQASSSSPCLLVEGTLQVNHLTNSRIFMRSSILPGFPQPKPEVDIVMNGKCPRTSDGFPEAGNTGCCYNPHHLSHCDSELWGHKCESLLLGTVVLGAGTVSWEKAVNSHDFEEPRPTPFADAVWSPGGSAVAGASQEFSFMLDYDNAKYKYFRIGDKHWNMDDPLLMYERDRNCDHIRDWPNASWEFSLEIGPESDQMMEQLSADVQLTRLSVSRQADCKIHR